MKKLIFSLIAVLLLAYLGLAYYFAGLVIHPPRRANAEVRGLMQMRAGIDIDTFRQKMPTGTDFQVASQADSILLIGTHFAHDTSRCAVIISHGYGSTRLSMMKYAPVFYDCGCDVIVYDHRAHGASEGTYGTGGALEAEDLHSITQWTQSNTGLSAKQIGWMGESWGGATVLQAGASGEDVAFIIAESSFQDWESAVFERAQRTYGNWISWMKPAVFKMASWRTGVDAWSASPLLKAPKVHEPTLVLHSQSDTETDSEQSVNIAAALPAATSRLHHLKWGAAHGNNIFTQPEAYKALLFDFIAEFVPNWPGNCVKQQSANLPETDSPMDEHSN